MSVLGITGAFSRRADPATVRACLLAYYRLLDFAQAERARLAAAGTLRERVEIAAFLEEIEGGIRGARAWLARCARSGGRGVPPPGAGRSLAADGPWMARFGSAVRTRPTSLSGGGPKAVSAAARASAVAAPALDITGNAYPLLLGQSMQELPGDTPASNFTSDGEIPA